MYLTVNKISNVYTNSDIAVSLASGSAISLVAGAGGILLDLPLTTYQPTTLTATGGTVTINAPIYTSNYSLSFGPGTTVSVGSGGSINTGTGTCSGSSACPVTTVTWVGTAGDHNWFTATNWDGNAVPTSSDDVLIRQRKGNHTGRRAQRRRRA